MTIRHVHAKLYTQNMEEALAAIFGHNCAASFATGPEIAEPFISPFSLMMTPALSSKYIHVPSFLRQIFRCRMTTADNTFFLSSGFPFLTEQINTSPTDALGIRFNRPWYPFTPKRYKFLAPELSAQFNNAAHGKPHETLNLAPDAPLRPRLDIVD
mmetsp:Transcript_10316/g.15582  ORF Transcript_10316/g.15582 Transcript_10316/m.15582 type:complete len:156 (+) Transcript_10316:76-543(+)